MNSKKKTSISYLIGSKAFRQWFSGIKPAMQRIIIITLLLKLVVLAAFIFADIFSGLCMIGVILFVKWLCREDHLPWVATSFGVAALSFAGCMVMYQPTVALGFPAALVGSVALTFVFGIPIDIFVCDDNDTERNVPETEENAWNKSSLDRKILDNNEHQSCQSAQETQNESQIYEAEVVDENETND